MSDNYPEVYRGDIFYISEGPYVGSEQKAGRPGVVVSNDTNNRYSSNVEIVFLTSQEKKPLPTHVEIICKSTASTVLCENIQTVSKERLGDFIRICSTAEMKKIDEALLISLGLEVPAATEDHKQVVELEAERNVYKKMYENLLDRMMPRV